MAARIESELLANDALHLTAKMDEAPLAGGKHGRTFYNLFALSLFAISGTLVGMYGYSSFG